MPKRRFNHSEMEFAIGEYITGRNAERNRDILRLYYLCVGDSASPGIAFTTDGTKSS